MRMPDKTGKVERVDTPFNTIERALASSVRLILSFTTEPFLGDGKMHTTVVISRE